MKTICSKSVSPFAVLILGCALFACGGVELRPELQSIVDRYEGLIETYEGKFAAAEGSHSQFTEVQDSYTRDLQLWMNEFDKVAPTMSDEEGLAVKASIEKLNRRAEKMFMGG